MTDRILPIGQNTDLVTFTIKIDGSDLDRAYDVVSITVHKEINKVPTARITLIDGNPDQNDFFLSNEEVFKPGKEVEILAGYHSQEETIFKGILIKHGLRVRTNGSRLVLECKDKAVKMTLGEKSAYFLEQTDSDAISAILGDHGVAGSVESTSVTHQELVQFKSTDWDFVLTRAEVNGLLCLVDDGEVSMVKPTIGAEVADLLYGATIIEFDGEMDARDQFSTATAYAWDYATQAVVEAAGADPGLEENGNITASELAEVIGLANYELIHNGQVVQEELQAWADAFLLRSRLAKSRGRVKTIGFSALKPGVTIKLSGLGERMNGKVYVSGVRHELANGEWLTDTQFGLDRKWFEQKHQVNYSPASGLLPAVEGLQTGVVSQLAEDPDGEDRILVKVPTISAADDGIWTRLATLDAGASRGTYFRPEIGDEVVVGFLNGDPRDPVVLGMLHSSSKPNPLPATDDNHEKGYISRSEMKMEFNDDVISFTLETPAGNKLVLSEEDGGITVEDENGNKIVMDSSGILIESASDINITATGDVNIEGANVNIAAQAKFAADGGAGAELTTGAVAKIEGSLVQIN